MSETKEPLEIERKYTIKDLPKDLDSYQKKFIEQTYLTTDPVIRVRREDDTYYMTYKGSGGMIHTEYNLPLTEEAYLTLKQNAQGNVITKTRYLLPIASPRFRDGFVPADGLSLTVELDVFEAPFAPLIIAEVEFPDAETADAYLPETWFLEEVTGDKNYSNASMSRRKF